MIIASTTEGKNLPVVLNGTGLPVLEALVEKFKAFAKLSAAALVQSAATLHEAKTKQSEVGLRNFCIAVGLEYKGSVYKKMMVIGREAKQATPERVGSQF